MAGQDLKDQIDTVQGFILALLGLGDEPEIRGNLHLQKEMYLLSRQLDSLAEACNFNPYLKGPYSEDVEAALSDLKALGLVEEGGGGRLHLTEEGKGLFQELAEEIPSEVKERLIESKDLFNDMTEDELLVFIYAVYPEMATESVIRERVMAKRVPIAKRLYGRGKVSLERAANLAGLTLREFQKEVAVEAG